ncbi:aldose epimerase family protein [Rickettsiella massiliensis]|uniref:aldose epimerase family protein n=1 Tax=Rickettsiella massiliensis TaxID=676517 RepID=UPI00029A6CB6|nr:aldose epimerase family protein [Rickettsiella massiliensis]
MPEVFCQPRVWGTLSDGQRVTLYTLRNSSGLAVSILNYGATLTSVKVPDAKGIANELTFGFDHLEAYLAHDAYFGATIGRVANRIAQARFYYANRWFPLSQNLGPHHLHGGCRGFDKALWQAEVVMQNETAKVELTHFSPDGDQGYPGNLKVKVSYSLSIHNELKIRFEATTDQPTPIDLTNHTYWNLAGAGSGPVFDHILQVFADQYVVTDAELLPTGQLAEVTETPFDFRQPHSLQERLVETPLQGYDLCFVLPDQTLGAPPRLAAQIKDPRSGRAMEVYTTQPGLQFYTTNNLEQDILLSEGRVAQRYGAFCMETQNLPGAVHYAHFPSPFLLPENQYVHETLYRLIW